MDDRSRSITFQSITIPSMGRSGYTTASAGGLRTPMRCLRLFVFAFLVPCLLIAVPLYQRRVTLAPRLYTLTATDMRGVRDGISSFWCEAQELTSDVPFTSYLTDGALPQRSRRLPVTLRHKLTLTDDVKEFWGFYLLRGSRISVSACARWPGTSLLLVHGWTALNECVWVGQMDSIEEESSEEEEEDDDEDEEILDPVRRQWREFLRWHHQPTPALDQGRTRTEPWTMERHQTQAPSTQTSTRPVEASRVTVATHPKVKEQTDGFSVQTSSVTGDTQVAPIIRDKDMHAEVQFVQQIGRRGRPVAKQQGETETSTAGSSGGSAEPTSQGTAARRSSPRELHAPLTNDVIEREVQSGRRRRKAPAATEPAAPAPRGRDASATAGRVIPLTYNGHRGRINQTLAKLETSHSEMMSSFSSSEEALLNCAGVIVNQPLEASATCSVDGDAAGSLLTVQVIGDDHYYLVFSSENEVLPVDVFFDVILDKTVYDVRGAEAVCTNSTSCHVPLGFWSSDSVVVEYPVAGNASEAVWSEHYTVRSSCEPRGWVVAVFIVAALFSLFVCAFC